MRYSIRESVFEAVIRVGTEADELNRQLEWEPSKTGNPFAFWQSPRFRGDKGILEPSSLIRVRQKGKEFEVPPLKYELQVNVTLLPPPFTKPTERDWFRKWLPGGLPGSSRRH
jgi:hypothetical protein